MVKIEREIDDYQSEKEFHRWASEEEKKYLIDHPEFKSRHGRVAVSARAAQDWEANA